MAQFKAEKGHRVVVTENVSYTTSVGNVFVRSGTILTVKDRTIKLNGVSDSVICEETATEGIKNGFKLNIVLLDSQYSIVHGDYTCPYTAEEPYALERTSDYVNVLYFDDDYSIMMESRYRGRKDNDMNEYYSFELSKLDDIIKGLTAIRDSITVKKKEA
jgi:hypothetical protein